MGFGGLGAEHVVSGRRNGAGAAGEEDGGEGLLLVILGAAAGEECAAGVFEAGPVDVVAAQAEEAGVDAFGNGLSGDLGEEGERVAVGVGEIFGAEGLCRMIEPGEEGVGAAEEEEVGVDEQAPAGETGVGIGELAEEGEFAAALAEGRKVFLGEHGVETGFDLGVGEDGGGGKEAEDRIGEFGREGAVVEEDRGERTLGGVSETPETEGGLIPVAATGEEVESDGRGVGWRRKWGQVVGGGFHGDAALLGAALFERAAGGEEFLHCSDRRVVGAVEEASGELAGCHERAAVLAELKRRS